MTANMGGRPFTNPHTAASLRPGPAARSFRTHRRLRGLYAVLTFSGFGGAVLAFAFAIWRWYFAYRHFGPAVVWRWSSPALAASAGLALAGTLGAIALWRSQGVTATVGPRTLTIQRGGALTTIPWEQIEEIYTSAVRYGLFAATQGGRARLTLRLADGPRIRFSDAMQDLPQLGDAIKGRVYPRLLEKKLDAFNRGEAISFGPLSLAPTGFKLRSTQLGWDKLESAALREGYLEVVPKTSEHRRRFRVPASKVPNVDLSLQLIQELIHAERGEGSDQQKD
jgi:hypothetical protein